MDPKSGVDKKPISRRRLIGYAWIGAGAIVLGELIFGTLAFLWPRRKGPKVETVFVAGKVTDLKLGEVTPFRKERAFILRTEEGLLAISAVCPSHCIVNWNEVLKSSSARATVLSLTKMERCLRAAPAAVRPLQTPSWCGKRGD
jgi:hypothetical protein